MKRVLVIAVIALATIAGVFATIARSNNNQTTTTEVAGAVTEENTQAAALNEAITSAQDENSGFNSNPSDNATAAASVVASAAASVPASTPTTPVVPTTPSTPTTPTTPTTPVNAAPTVSISTPAANSVLSGTAQITVTASDDVAVTSVQLIIDGSAYGSPLMTAPYQFSWDTLLAQNGAHTISARVSDGSLTATAPLVNVTVNNQVVVPPTTPANLISNPSLEVASANMPTGWAGDGYGTNDRSFSYENQGHDGTHSVKVSMTTRTDGDAKWIFTPVPVTGGKYYTFTDWYKSDVTTEIDAVVTVNGVTQYFYVATVPAASDWTKASVTFQMPAGATDATFTHILYSTGYLQTDEYGLSEYVPAMFNNAIVSLTFDDAWKSIYTNGLPLLTQYGLVSTQYLLTDPTVQGYSDYMSVADMQAFYAAGHEIAGHTAHHCDLTGATSNAANDDPACGQPISNSQVATELLTCKQTLESWIPGLTVQSFATPYGAYNSSVLSAIKTAGYASHRSVDNGINTKDGMSVDANGFVSNIKVRNMLSTTTLADVQAWVDEAIATKAWLVIVYHEVSTTPADATYSVTPANLEAQLSYIHDKVTAGQIENKTVGAALAELIPQL